MANNPRRAGREERAKTSIATCTHATCRFSSSFPFSQKAVEAFFFSVFFFWGGPGGSRFQNFSRFRRCAASSPGPEIHGNGGLHPMPCISTPQAPDPTATRVHGHVTQQDKTDDKASVEEEETSVNAWAFFFPLVLFCSGATLSGRR